MGLTGGIASGKSVVAARLAEHGAVVVDADAIAREVVEPGTPALARIAEEFGPGVIAPDGSLDRAALGAIVFADPAKLAVAERRSPTPPCSSCRSAASPRRAPPTRMRSSSTTCRCSSEVRGKAEFDVVVVVSAPEETRIERMVSLRGMSRDEAERRIRSQVSDEERRALADIVIESGGTLDETLAQADEVWAAAAPARCRRRRVAWRVCNPPARCAPSR